MLPFPHPPHRTGHADLPHPALGEDFTPSPTTGFTTKLGQAYEPEVLRKGARSGELPPLRRSDFVLESATTDATAQAV